MMGILQSLLGFLLMFGFIALIVGVSVAVIFAIGLGAGYVIHWLVPAISQDAGFIAGVIAAIAASYVVYRVLGLSTGDDQDDDDEGSEGKNKVIYVVDQFDLPRSNRRRASRRKRPPTELP